MPALVRTMLTLPVWDEKVPRGSSGLGVEDRIAKRGRKEGMAQPRFACAASVPMDCGCRARSIWSQPWPGMSRVSSAKVVILRVRQHRTGRVGELEAGKEWPPGTAPIVERTCTHGLAQLRKLL